MKFDSQNFSKCFSMNSAVKNLTFFRKIQEKNIFATKKKWKLNNFSWKIRHDLSLGFDDVQTVSDISALLRRYA